MLSRNGRYGIAVLGIIILSILLRFVNWENRWGLAYDQALFAVQARHALASHQLPLLGPFSSGGPFQTGGEWYWVVMLGAILFPFRVDGPWVFLAVLGVVFVGLTVWWGRKLFGWAGGLVFGLLSAVSPAQITQSTNLSNQTPIALISLLALVSAAGYTASRRITALFFLALFTGLAAAIHLQGVALFPLVVVTLMSTRSFSPKAVFTTVAGLILPWIPVLIADYAMEFTNTKRMVSYLLLSQNPVTYEELGRRWLTLLTEMMPRFWSFTTGGYGLIAAVTAVVMIPYVVNGYRKRRDPPIIGIALVSFIAMVVILRYIKVMLFESFVVFLHPFILLFTAYSAVRLFETRKFMGVLFAIVVVVGSVILVFPDIAYSTNVTAEFSRDVASILQQEYPGETFAVYDMNYKHAFRSVPLVMFLQYEGKTDVAGKRIGVTLTLENFNRSYLNEPVYRNIGGWELYPFGTVSPEDLARDGWAPVNPPVLYDATQKWYGQR